MGRYPMKRDGAQSVSEMAEQLTENSAGNRLNRLYPEVSAEVKSTTLANVINQQREMMKLNKERGRRVDLDDLAEVEEVVNRYLDACIQSSVFPTMLGLSAALGWSRPAVYQYISNKQTESARYLDNLRSSWAAIMAEMSLKRLASEATSIFLLKNAGQGLTDRIELSAQPSMTDPTETEPSAADIAARYLMNDQDE